MNRVPTWICVATTLVWILGVHIGLASEPARDPLVQLKLLSNNGDLTTREKAEALEHFYADAFRGRQNASYIHTASPSEVEVLFQAANTVSFYTGKSAYAQDMALDLERLSRAGMATGDEYEDLYGAHLEARDFVQAEAVATQHLGGSIRSPTVLGTVDSSKPAVLLPRRDGSLQATPVAFAKNQIVIVAHPLCHFTQNAVHYIEQHPGLQRVFAEHSLWVVPPDRKLDTTVVQQWNNHHPALPMSFAYNRFAWPHFDAWDTPVFYFLRDGNLVDTIAGWPTGGHAKDLNDALARLGLLEQSRQATAPPSERGPARGTLTQGRSQ